LLAIAAIAFVLPSPSASNLAALIVLAYGIGAGIGWFMLRRRDFGAGEQGPSREQVSEGLYSFGFSIAGMIMLQFERLIIPGRLTMADLAVFSVASALATSPFRMLQIGVGFTLLPRLRACRSVAQIRALLIKEGSIVAGATVVLIAAVLVVTPYVLSVFLKGRYTVGTGLLTAIFVIGIIRIGSAFAVSCVQALGYSRQFRQLTIGAWICVATSLLCAYGCSRFGLTGIVYGVGAGWLLLTVIATTIAFNIDSTPRFAAAAGPPP
jgi:O-antigen/teichoic acid export membrane protein